jgi:hypothetical protein
VLISNFGSSDALAIGSVRARRAMTTATHRHS